MPNLPTYQHAARCIATQYTICMYTSLPSVLEVCTVNNFVHTCMVRSYLWAVPNITCFVLPPMLCIRDGEATLMWWREHKHFLLYFAGCTTCSRKRLQSFSIATDLWCVIFHHYHHHRSQHCIWYYSGHILRASRWEGMISFVSRLIPRFSMLHAGRGRVRNACMQLWACMMPSLSLAISVN